MSELSPNFIENALKALVGKDITVLSGNQYGCVPFNISGTLQEATCDRYKVMTGHAYCSFSLENVSGIDGDRITLIPISSPPTEEDEEALSIILRRNPRSYLKPAEPLGA